MAIKALVLTAHGSRREASNEEVKKLTDSIADQVKDEFPVVEAGFLDIAQPSIVEAIGRCIERGATDIRLIPYFLSAGRHVQQDIPSEVDKARNNHPDISITILPHIGGAPGLGELICGLVTNNL